MRGYKRTMRALRSLIFGGFALLVPGQTVLAEERELTFEEIVTGTWGFEKEGASCEDNPHTIEFSADGQFMFLRYSRSVDGEPPPITKYELLGEGPGFMRMAMEGETRTTDEGQPVKWDMVLLAPDSYCWHRTDWQEGGCTQPASRCSSEADEKNEVPPS